MTWVPDPNRIDDKIKQYLTDFEIRKVKKLQKRLNRAAFPRGKMLLEKEILLIYSAAAKRNKSNYSYILRDWLNEDEANRVDEYIDKIATSKSFKHNMKCEADIYRIYLESIARQAKEFGFKEEVEKYIEMLEECETQREANILSEIIKDILKKAR